MNATGAVPRPDCAKPLSAVCFAGAARSFASPLVISSLQHNLVEPLAGSNARLFLSLKTADSKKTNVAGVGFAQHRSQANPLITVLRDHHWLAPLIEEAVVINGSGAYIHGGSVYHRISVVQGDEKLWRQYCPRNCDTNGSGGTHNATGILPCCRKAGYLLDGNNEERLIQCVPWQRGGQLHAHEMHMRCT